MSSDAASSNGSPADSHSHSYSPSPAPETHNASFGRPAISRALNPAPIATRPPLGVSIATASPPGSGYPSPGAGTPCSGPTSTSYVVPPRPKPGRKPATDEPASKRKAQNRESQRAFRARKAAKLNEMKTHAEVAEQRHRQEMQQKIMELADKDRRIRQLESVVDQLKESQEQIVQERDHWKDRALRLESNVKLGKDWPNRYQSPSMFTPPSHETPSFGTPTHDTTLGCGICKADGPCMCLDAIANETQGAIASETHDAVFLPTVPLNLGSSQAPATPIKPMQPSASRDDPALFAEREIDFTAQFSSNKRPRLDIPFLTQPSRDEPGSTEAGATEAGCGFCTADSFCVCRELAASHDEKPRGGDDVVMIDIRSSSSKRTATGPGTCSDCMSNPKQRAWCQRISQLRTSERSYFSQPPSSRRSSIVSSDIGSPMEPRANYAPVASREQSIGCSDAFKLFEGRVPTDRDAMDWSTLKPISPDTRREPLPGLQQANRTYSALELDTASVIATLQQTMGPLIPRKEDGAHADLVRIAAECREASNSPL